MSVDFSPSASLANLKARAQALARVREFFALKQVLEVQTPLLGSATVTDPAINTLVVSSGVSTALQGDEPSASNTGFLQTSTEYHQKRLLAAGGGDNYTLGPVFRADEEGRLHNPEFTMLEWYRLGYDDRALMAELCELVDQLLGASAYQTHSYAALIERVPENDCAFQDVAASDVEDLRLALAIDSLGAGRHFVVDYPAKSAVLARLDPDNPSIARRFELVIDGIEIANGYFELTDATLHRARFESDNAMRAARGLPQVAIDQALLGAIDAGLPDCAGVAVGFDRLLMLKLGVDNIEDVQSFCWSSR